VRDPAGSQLILSHADYRAEIVTVGACLRTLARGGVDLVATWPVGEPCLDFHGAVLMPWANRVADGRYSIGGTAHQLPLNEPERRNALHGLVHWVDWTVTARGEDHVRLQHALVPQAGYPFALDLEVDYRLDDTGLHTTLTATNAGVLPAPYGAASHPYLTVGRRVDECELTLPARTWAPMDDRGLPGEARPVGETAYDFTAARRLDGLVLDHPYGGVAEGDTAVLRDPDSGREVRLRIDGGFGWWHVYTADALAHGARCSLAIEPSTAPPDAFNSGHGLVLLEPGQTHRASFTISGTIAG